MWVKKRGKLFYQYLAIQFKFCDIIIYFQPMKAKEVL